MTYELLHGDCLEVMAAMDAGSVDAVVCDPPYHLTSGNAVYDLAKTGSGNPRVRRRTKGGGFMGKTWDGGDIATTPEVWAEAIRVLKPSHYLLAFGGTRTWHRLACAIEDAGFGIKDTLMWLYGSGFPKGKSCLKPAWEPIILARKPGPMRELGIEECRVGTDATLRPNGRSAIWSGGGMATDVGGSASGRWPANLILDEEAGAMLDGQSGERPSSGRYGESGSGKPAGIFGNISKRGRTHFDSGGASRFFYCAKASRSERNAGCEGMEARHAHDDDWVSKNRLDQPCAGKRSPQGNHHPTVKPLTLMRWLVKLVAQPGDVVLDPFMGSGTTGVACAEERREFIGIEREAEYIEIARRRIDHASAQGRLPLDESPPLPPVAGRPT